MGNNAADDQAMIVETVTDEKEEDNNGESNKKDNNEEDLEKLLSVGEDDNVFVTAEEEEARKALERRQKRKRRLEQLQEQESKTINNNDPPPKKTVNKNESLRPEQVKEELIAAAVALPKMEETENNNDNGSDGGDSDSDGSDMFASDSSKDDDDENQQKRSKPTKAKPNDNKQQNTRQDGFDDTDGYYKASIGETMELEVLQSSLSSDNENNKITQKLRFRVLGVIGKGVFSTVLKCSTETNVGAAETTNNDGIPTSISFGTTPESQQQHGLPPEVAIKCIRSNETMAKAALDEIKFLIRLRDSPGIVPLLLPSSESSNNCQSSSHNNPNYYVPPSPIDFRGHTILVFPYYPYNLRDVLQKFGKGVGLSLGAVKNYFGQLLSAATQLQKKRVLHADIKPDNILVTADFSRVLLADFGSAFESAASSEDDTGMIASHSINNEAVTPYLVSRFYRAPEIILGLQPLTNAIDLWSLAVTAGELFLGKVLLNGSNNNDMLNVMMETLGPFSGKTIKSHLLQTKKHANLQAHFSEQDNKSLVFRKELFDSVLGKAVHKQVAMSGGNFATPTLKGKLLRAKSPKDTRHQVLLFADLLTKCLVLDPSKRISIKAALKHEFFAVPKPSKQQQS